MSRLIKALDNRFYVKFMQLEIGLLYIEETPDTNILKTEVLRNLGGGGGAAKIKCRQFSGSGSLTIPKLTVILMEAAS